MNTYKHFFKILFFSMLVISLSACLTNVEEEPIVLTDDPDALDPCESITFSAKVKPIIDANCIQCHGSGGNFPNLTSYSLVSSNASSVKNAVVTRRMPQGGTLSQTDIDAIACWVDNGAENN